MGLYSHIKRKIHAKKLKICVIFRLFSIPHLVVTQQQKTILHIGCGGDASWAMEVASKYPKWTVIGLDNYQHYTTYTTSSSGSFLSRNFKFIKCLDVLQALRNFPDQTFDFIASRFSVTSYTFDQYQSVINECIRITKPGGYIEVMEMDLRIYHQRIISSSITQLLNNEGTTFACICIWNVQIIDKVSLYL